MNPSAKGTHILYVYPDYHMDTQPSIDVVSEKSVGPLSLQPMIYITPDPLHGYFLLKMLLDEEKPQ
jgi:hypothetical protein